jgi:hypothetical protein
MAVGGWKSFESMQQYVRLQKSTVRRDYDRAIAKAKEMAADDISTTQSLEEFALGNAAPAKTPSIQ